MSFDREGFVIDFTADLSGVQDGVNQLIQTSESLPENFKETQTNINNIATLLQSISGADGANPFSNLPKQLEFSVRQAVNLAKPQIDRINSLMKGDLSSSDQIVALNQHIGFLAANLENVVSAASAFSKLTVNMRTDLFANLNKDIRNYQRAISDATYSAAISSKMGAASDKRIEQVFSSRSGYKAGMSAMGQTYGWNEAQQRSFMNAMIKLSAPSYLRKDYYDSASRYANKALPVNNRLDEYISYKDRMPARFRDLPITPNVFQEQSAKMSDVYSQELSKHEYKIVRDLAARNEVFRQSLINVGAGAYQASEKYGAGSFFIPKTLTRLQLAQAEASLFYDKMIPSWEGNPVYYKSLGDKSAESQRSLINKGNTTVLDGLAALHALQNVNKNVDPVYVSPSSVQRYRGTDGQFVGHISKIPKNQYMVMSLTPDDFKSGAIPPSTKVIEPRNRHTLNVLPGESSFIMLEDSFYTELAGMRGHNTPGTGVRGSVAKHPEMFDDAPMLIVDYSSYIHDKDVDGNLIWGEDGKPKASDPMLKEIAGMFARNKHNVIEYGDGKKYYYPIATRTVDGKQHRYVPTNVKGGGVYMINEDSYRRISQTSLDRLGRNVFDNFADLDAVYQLQKDANKIIEAENRELTPSVPFTQIGGVNPSVDKIGFVDMGSFESSDGRSLGFGHDGSMFFMPGFVPGNDAIVRAPGIKGVAQTVDFKRIIKDVYGIKDGDPFFMPGINTPKELKQLYHTQGIEAIINDPKYGKKAISDYFIDVMKMDALIPESVIKTSLFDGMNSKQASNVMSVVYDLYNGFRAVDTGREMSISNQVGLGSQMVQNMVLSAEQLEANSLAWDEYIYKLENDVDFQKERVFGRPDDPLDIAFRENPSIIATNHFAQKRLAETIEAAKDNQRSGRLFADNLLSMRLALANPGEWILKAGSANNILVQNKRLANTLALSDSLIGAAGYGADMIGRNKYSNVLLGGGRYPNTPNEDFALTVSGKYVADVIRKYGLNKDGLYMNAKTIQEMGGGDFDGDTVQLVAGWLANAFAETQKVRSAQLSPFSSEISESEPLKMEGDKKISPNLFADMLYRQATAPIFMGGVSNAIDALSQGDWNDDIWLKTTGSGAVQLRKMYDIDSTFAKTGILANWTKQANNAKHMGVPFRKVFKGLGSALTTGDFSKMKKFSDVNFPSIFNSATALSFSSLNRNPMSSDSLNSLINAQRDLAGITQYLTEAAPQNVEQAMAKYLDKNIQVMAEMMTRGSVMSSADYDELDSNLAVWNDMVIQEFKGPGLTDDRKDILEKYKNQIAAQQQRLKAASDFGLTQKNVELNKGYASSGMFKGFSFTGQGGTFQTAVDEANRQNDFKRLQIAAQVATNPILESATRQAYINQQIASAKNQADKFNYSHTFMSQFEKDPVAWYDQQILKRPQEQNIHMALGTSIHKAIEEWAKNRLENQKDQSKELLTSEQLEQILFKDLTENQGKFFSVDDTGHVVPAISSVKNKLKGAFSFIRKLPEMFLDEDIIGIEHDITIPGLGKKILSPDDDVTATGKIDLRTRKRLPGEGPGQATGAFINTDWKPSAKTRDWGQFLLYAAGIPTDIMRVVGYGDDTSYSKNVEQKDVDENLARFRGDVSDIQTLAITTGFDLGLMQQSPVWHKVAPMLKAQAETELEIINLRAKRDSERQESLYHLKGSSKQGTTSSVSDEQLEAWRIAADLMLTNAGTGIAEGMSLQADVTDYINQLEKMQAQLRSKEYRTKHSGVNNPWAGYAYSLEEGYSKKMKEFEARGASATQMASLRAAQDMAQTQFDQSVRTAAVFGLSDLNKELQDEMHAADGKTAVTAYSKQFEDLKKRIDEAKQAYEVLKNKLSNNKGTKEDKEALEQAEKNLADLEITEKARIEQIRKKSKEAFDADAATMFDAANFGELRSDTRISQQINDFVRKRDNNILQANQDFENSLIDETERDRRIKEMKNLDVAAYQERLYQDLYSGTQGRYADRLTSIQRSAGQKDIFSQMTYRHEDYAKQIKDTRESLEKDLSLGKITKADYDADIAKLNELEKTTTKSSLAFTELSNSMSRTIGQFGRRLFHQAAQEVKRFVMEFDSAMTEIQMVTLKTDDEISALGDGLINQAIDLKVSVGEITSAATSLYRQGLNDDQVNERLVDVTKFAKTAKVETADAIKLITVALNSEMVNSSEEAMDVISALSDSAATEAAQITKGLQKSLAAAKEVGVTYKELVAMLTVITSKTQLGGSVAGTTMRNVLSRLTRVGSSEMIIDESGAAISGSQQARVLSSIGVETYRKQDGSIDAYDILSQIGMVWNDLSDAKRNQVVYVLGGAEQFSNVAALMQGFAETDENGNNLMQQYMDIAKESDGITDKKYANYIDSLAASMESFRSSFDAFINSVTESDFVINFFDYLSSSVSGITKLNEALFKIPSTLAMIAAGALAITALTPGLRELVAIIAAISAVGYGVGSISKNIKILSPTDAFNERIRSYDTTANNANSIYDKASSYNKRLMDGDTLSNQELIDYKMVLHSLESLGYMSINAGESVKTLSENALRASEALKEAKENIDARNQKQINSLFNSAGVTIDENISNSSSSKEYLSEDELYYIKNAKGKYDDAKIKMPLGDFAPHEMRALEKMYDLLEESGYFSNNELKVPGIFGKRDSFSLFGIEIPYPNFYSAPQDWANIDKQKRKEYFYDANEDLYDMMFGVVSDDEISEMYVNPRNKLPDESKNIIDNLVDTIVTPELIKNGTAALIKQTIYDTASVAYAENPDSFSMSTWMRDNLLKDGNYSLKGLMDFTNSNAPESEKIKLNTQNIPINMLAISSDTAATLNKSSEDTTAVKLLEFLQSATGESIEEKLSNFATEAVGIENWGDYIAHKDNADLAAAISEMFAFEEDGTPKLKKEVSESEIQTLENLLVSKVPRLFMESYRSEAIIRKEALDNYDYIMQKNTSKDRASAFANLSPVNTTNEQLQQELKDMLGEDLLNLILSGVADDETIAYAESTLRYGGTQESEFAYRDHAMTSLFGVGYRDGLTEEEMNAAALQYKVMMYDPLGSLQLDKIRELEGGVDLLEELSKILDGTSEDAKRCGEALQQVVDGIGSEEISQLLKYDRAQQRVADTFQALADGGEDAANAYSQLLSESKSLSSASWAIDQYKSGSRDDKVIDILGDFGVDQQMLKKAAGQDADAAIEIIEMTYEDRFRILQENFSQNFGDITDYVTQFEQNTNTEFDVGKFMVNGSVDVSALLDAFAGANVIVDQTWAAVVQAMASAATFSVTADGDQVKLDLSKINSSGKNYYGGGSGGTKKTSGDKLIERLGYGRDLYEHQIQMVQYEQTRYQNADELGNYGKMLEEEIAIEKEYLPVLESNIRALRDELDAVKDGSEEWYKLRDAILDAEEQYAEINNTIDENEKKLEENQQAILKLHTDLEQMVVEEIELRIESEKEMLDGSVSMQDIILNAVKQRYQDEWDLIKKDIDKKKEALEEEKSLIDERLDARREAEDEAAQYEELAELKKQLALVSMDSTRTKDAASLRESIAELEKEIGWNIAEKEAENEKDAIQDQIDAYDDYVAKGDEDLEALLSDANNFAEEVNGVLKLSQTELFEWLKQNVKEYSESLNDAQKQMVQSWEATYKQMLGITDTYWNEVNAILSAKDTFLEYMKQSEEYIYASDDEREQLLYQWSDSYDKWRSAQKNDANYDHTDPGLGDWSGNEYSSSSSSSSSSGGGSKNTQSSKKDSEPYYVRLNGKVYGPYDSISDANSFIKSQGFASGTIIRSNGEVIQAGSSLDQNRIPIPVTENGNKSNGHWKYLVTVNGEVMQTGWGRTSRTQAQEDAKEWIKKNGIKGAKYSTYYYKKGGIADFTGPAWLDGTPSEPERILSAEQTRSFDELVQIMDDFKNAGVSMSAIRDMMNWSTMVNIPYSMSHIDSSAYQGGSSTIGDIFVTITEAQINDDRDIEELANIVGQKFVKEIGKQGFNVARYSF